MTAMDEKKFTEAVGTLRALKLRIDSGEVATAHEPLIAGKEEV